MDEDQTLEKNKVIAKLTVLEHKKLMGPLITHSANNNLLIQTVGSAFASSEQIYYGDIEVIELQIYQKKLLICLGYYSKLKDRIKKL